MKNQYTSRATCTLILGATLLTSVLAQNWTVGVPVNMSLGALHLNGSGCYPNIDEMITFPASQAAGVQHIAVMTTVAPEDTNYISPGISSIHTGDTMFINTSAQRNVFFPEGSGSLVIDFRAIGTPTHAGDPHPCVGTDVWISNLGICPEALTPTLQFNCIVQGSLQVQETAMAVGHFIFPSAENGERLSITGTTGGSYLITDAIGRSIASGSAQVLLSGIDLSALRAGLYTITLSDPNGLARSVRFAISGR